MTTLLVIAVLLAVEAVASAWRRTSPGRSAVNAVITAVVVLLLARNMPWNSEIPFAVWPVILAAAAALVGVNAARAAATLRRSAEAARTQPR
ncbi:hypothetical protein [Corynebacterium sp. LK2510]|uniref:hypothetical protein n=1 Tax=Corynebacterium sp. LK2510 TaxID=3110472 RepID=UPI0034CEB2DF